MPLNPSIAHPGTLGSTQSAAGTGTSYASDNYAPVLFVNTVTGVAGNNGLTPANPMPTIAEAFATMDIWEAAQAHSADNTIINVLGVIAEQVTTPLSGESGVGVSGVTIRGLVGGNPRHDDGARWKQAASAGAAPLVTVRGQGWTFENILMVPETGYSAIRLRRQEDATYPDGSHAVIRKVRFIGNVAITTAGGIGIEDYGGSSNVTIEDCSFDNLVSAIIQTNVSIDSQNKWTIQRNTFRLNTHDVRVNASEFVVKDNNFMTLYHVTTHPTTLNLAHTGSGTYANMVRDNWFSDTSGNVTIAKGYKAATPDLVWANHVAGTAAYIVAVPA